MAGSNIMYLGSRAMWLCCNVGTTSDGGDIAADSAWAFDDKNITYWWPQR
jgi:hypothetical protein